MNNSVETIYDPTQTQIDDVTGLLGTDELSIEEISRSPETIKVILRQQKIQLFELHVAKTKLEEYQTKNNQLIEERENLRINLATSKERETGSLLEIPISFVSGYSINILSNNPNNGIGWFFLIISIILLLFLRRSQIQKILSNINIKRVTDENKN